MPHTGIWFDFVAVPAALISRILLVMNLLAFLSLPARELIPSHRPVIPNRLRRGPTTYIDLIHTILGVVKSVNPLPL